MDNFDCNFKYKQWISFVIRFLEILRDLETKVEKIFRSNQECEGIMEPQE